MPDNNKPLVDVATLNDGLQTAIKRAELVAKEAKDEHFINQVIDTVVKGTSANSTIPERIKRIESLTRGLNNYADEMKPVASAYAKMQYDIMSEEKPKELKMADRVGAALNKGIGFSATPEESQKHFDEAAKLYQEGNRTFKEDPVKLAVFNHLTHRETAELFKRTLHAEQWNKVVADANDPKFSELNAMIQTPPISKYTGMSNAELHPNITVAEYLTKGATLHTSVMNAILDTKPPTHIDPATTNTMNVNRDPKKQII